MTTPNLAIAVQSVSKTYVGAFGKHPVEALKSITLEVRRGDIFGLLGPNGAGKTTLIKILLSIVRPTSGSATLLGTSIAQPVSRQQIGFLPENHHYPAYLTATQTLQIYGKLSGLSPRVIAERTPVLLADMDLTDWHDRRIKTFSKGMMQRLGLAQALLSDPALLFLDEPTDGVDPIGRREIRTYLLRLKEQGKTIFINSHLLSEVEQVCTRVAILNKGVIVREGPMERFTTQSSLYDLIASRIPAEVQQALRQVLSEVGGTSTEPEDDLYHYQLNVESRSQLNEYLDQLRHADVQIDTLRPVRRSLEDSFFDLLDKPA